MQRKEGNGMKGPPHNAGRSFGLVQGVGYLDALEKVEIRRIERGGPLEAKQKGRAEGKRRADR